MLVDVNGTRVKDAPKDIGKIVRIPGRSEDWLRKPAGVSIPDKLTPKDYAQLAEEAGLAKPIVKTMGTG